MDELPAISKMPRRSDEIVTHAMPEFQALKLMRPGCRAPGKKYRITAGRRPKIVGKRKA